MTHIATDPGNTARLAQDFEPDHMTRVNRARQRDIVLRRAVVWGYLLMAVALCSLGAAVALTSKM